MTCDEARALRRAIDDFHREDQVEIFSIPILGSCRLRIGENRADARSSPRSSTPAHDHPLRPSRGRNRGRSRDATSIVSIALHTEGRLHLALKQISSAILQIGRAIDVGMADAVEMRQHRHGDEPASAPFKALPPRGIIKSISLGMPLQDLDHLAIRIANEHRRIAGRGRRRSSACRSAQRARALVAERFAPATQHYCIARLQAQYGRHPLSHWDAIRR